jgi:very-short-patch-repair endonuclease
MTARSPNLIKTGHYLPYDPELVERAKELRRNMTEAEQKLWYGYLRTLRPRFLRQRPIDNFIVDFYCAEHKLVIEIEGEPHFGPQGEGRDNERTEILEGYGLRVMRFSNASVMESFGWVCETIRALVEKDR